MENKTLKIIVHLLVLFMMLMTSALPVMAWSLEIVEPIDPGSGVTSDLTSAGGKIAGLISVIGAAVAIVILIWLAIKYMTASASEKADVKKSAVPYLIGAILLFAASGVLGLIRTFATGIFG